MYLCWRTLIFLNNEVVLESMVTGHTKNVVEGSFGLFEGILKSKMLMQRMELWN